jgi:hypothetical protein
MSSEQKITIEFTVKEAELVIAALSEMPYRVSAQLISQIHSSGMAQLRPAPQDGIQPHPQPE